ncbi:MAG: prepilin-type N-terminal cleavage/methylation domain-containing protein [Planctomycetes bacterium]|nr:prepilin-type N-terminal cleavage/methylation domain-containing protein [Planctomycetota bacterium]
MPGIWLDRPGFRRGMTLVEVMVTLAVLTIAMTGALSVYFTHIRTEMTSEERRRAALAAQAKLDEIRSAIAGGASLDQIFNDYGPLPLPGGGPKATFDVEGLRPIGKLATGTVSIISDEAPNEADFGIDYRAKAMPPKIFGVDINGDRKYSGASPYPFPLDLNGNGTTEHFVAAGFRLLPVVVTIQWNGTYGTERMDIFALFLPPLIQQ